MLPKWTEQALVTMFLWAALAVLMRLFFPIAPLVAVVAIGPLIILILFKSIDELITIRLEEEELIAETTRETPEHLTDD